MITGPLCKAARALVEASRTKLSANADIDQRVVELFERGIDIPGDPVIAALQSALEERGLSFSPRRALKGSASD